MSLLPAVIEYPPQPPAPEVQPSLLQRLLTIVRGPAPKTSPAKVNPQGSSFYLVTQQAGKVPVANAPTLRALSVANPWVRAAINIRRDQVAGAEWDIVPFSKKGRPPVRLANEIRDLFDRPNARLDSFYSFVQSLIEDILVLDAGCIEIVRTAGGDIAELWATPGDYIRVSTTWDGSDPDEPRYFWYPDGNERARFRNDDFVYMMQNPRTNTPIGISPLEILRTTIVAEMSSNEYNRRMVDGAAPDGLLNIGDDAPPEKVQEAQSKWDAKVAGQSVVTIVGGYKNPSFIAFNKSNREMQFREWQDYLVRQIAIGFGLQPQDLGITFDVNRSTSETQSQNTDDRALRTLMATVQNYLTREIVWDPSFGGKENGLAFRFAALNLKETAQKAAINKIAVTVPWKSLNEARVDDGRQPKGDLNDENNIFNHVLVSSPTGIVDLDTGDYVVDPPQIQTAEMAAQARAAQPAKPTAGGPANGAA